MVILFAALMVSQIEYEVFPDQFSTSKNKIKLAFIIIAAAAALARPRLLIFPILSVYIIIGMVKEAYQFFYRGVGYVKKRQSRNVKETEQ